MLITGHIYLPWVKGNKNIYWMNTKITCTKCFFFASILCHSLFFINSYQKTDIFIWNIFPVIFQYLHQTFTSWQHFYRTHGFKFSLFKETSLICGFLNSRFHTWYRIILWHFYNLLDIIFHGLLLTTKSTYIGTPWIIILS